MVMRLLPAQCKPASTLLRCTQHVSMSFFHLTGFCIAHGELTNRTLNISSLICLCSIQCKTSYLHMLTCILHIIYHNGHPSSSSGYRPATGRNICGLYVFIKLKFENARQQRYYYMHKHPKICLV